MSLSPVSHNWSFCKCNSGPFQYPGAHPLVDFEEVGEYFDGKVVQPK